MDLQAYLFLNLRLRAASDFFLRFTEGFSLSLTRISDIYFPSLRHAAGVYGAAPPQEPPRKMPPPRTFARGPGRYKLYWQVQLV